MTRYDKRKNNKNTSMSSKITENRTKHFKIQNVNKNNTNIR